MTLRQTWTYAYPSTSNKLSTVTKGSNVRTFTSDRPLKMTDGTQAIVWDAIYRPFGEVHAVSGTAANNLRFPGQYLLIESGLHCNWHRHCDPTLGR